MIGIVEGFFIIICLSIIWFVIFKTMLTIKEKRLVKDIDKKLDAQRERINIEGLPKIARRTK